MELADRGDGQILAFSRKLDFYPSFPAKKIWKNPRGMNEKDEKRKEL